MGYDFIQATTLVSSYTRHICLVRSHVCCLPARQCRLDIVQESEPFTLSQRWTFNKRRAGWINVDIAAIEQKIALVGADRARLTFLVTKLDLARFEGKVRSVWDNFGANARKITTRDSLWQSRLDVEASVDIRRSLTSVKGNIQIHGSTIQRHGTLNHAVLAVVFASELAT
jgi:hypothetical protein